MPAINNEGNKRPGLLVYLGYFVCACLVLALVGYIALSLFMVHLIGDLTSSTSVPIKSSGNYRFPYTSAAQAKLQLPDGNGTLVYMHELLDPATSSGGERGIRLISKSGKTQDWPLPYSSVSNVRVGIYWYPKMFGGGPYIRFYDATGESVLDLNRREVGGLTRAGGGVYEADYSYNTTTFSTNDPIVRPSTGASPRVIPKGKPVRVLTSVMPPKSGKYLGSVVRVGNKIVFSPAGN